MTDSRSLVRKYQFACHIIQLDSVAVLFVGEKSSSTKNRQLSGIQLNRIDPAISHHFSWSYVDIDITQKRHFPKYGSRFGDTDFGVVEFDRTLQIRGQLI